MSMRFVKLKIKDMYSTFLGKLVFGVVNFKKYTLFRFRLGMCKFWKFQYGSFLTEKVPPVCIKIISKSKKYESPERRQRYFFCQKATTLNFVTTDWNRNKVYSNPWFKIAANFRNSRRTRETLTLLKSRNHAKYFHAIIGLLFSLNHEKATQMCMTKLSRF